MQNIFLNKINKYILEDKMEDKKESLSFHVKKILALLFILITKMISNIID